MPDLALTEEQLEFQKLAREFAENELAPRAYDCDQKASLPEEVLKQCWELGLMTALIPDEYGGLGLSLKESCVIAEELASGCSGIYGAIEANILAQLVLLSMGSGAQKDKFLKQLSDAFCAASVDAQLISDNEPRLDSLRVKDDYVLKGESVIANAERAAWFVVAAHGSPKRLFIIEKGAKGIEYGAPVYTLGRKALPLTVVKFQSVQVSSASTIEVNADQWCTVKDQASCLLAAGSLGIARSAMQNAIQYSKERKTFGVPIAQHQAVGFMIADMAKDIEATRLLVYQACAAAESAATQSISPAVARIYAQEMAIRVATDAVQVYGGYGYSKEYPVEKLMRDAKTYQVYQGDSVSAKTALGRDLVHR